MTVTSMPPATTEAAAAETEPRGGRKKLLVVLLAVVLVAVAAYWFVLRPTPEAAPEPGEVVALDPIQINLAQSHYLRVGIALQLTADAHEADGSKALDATIDTFSGAKMEDVQDPEKRRKMKQRLEKELGELYHHEVMEVYFTEFVTQ